MADERTEHEPNSTSESKPPSGGEAVADREVHAPELAHAAATPDVAHTAAPAHGASHGGHGSAHGGHAHAVAGGHGHDHALAHTTPVSLLIGILAALMVLTLITVAVTGIDLGAQGNLVVAMVIATVKAALVVAFFMHLVWDKKLHLILFLVSVLFLILFLSGSVTDRAEYEPDIRQFQVGPR